MKNIRYLQQTDRARIEHDLVLTRMGELGLRDLDLLIRGLIYPNVSVDAIIVEGLLSSPGAGLSVDVTAPAFAVQKQTDGSLSNEVAYVADSNDGVDYNIVLDAADGSNDRIDILEGRIQTRSAFTDDNVSVADPITAVISATTRDRDFEVYLNIQKVTGTPAGSPVPPSITAATAGILLGSVDINTGTTDLSIKYNFNFAIGDDENFVTVDLRGGTPNATTAAEILTAINGAGFGVVAALNGNFLELTAPGTGVNSIVKVKQLLDSTLDAYTIVTGFAESAGYLDIYQGGNAFFKIAELFVPTSAGSLTATNVRSREEKNTDWDSDAATIENATSFDAHRKSVPIDHADASIFLNHLDSTVINSIQAPLTNFRGLNSLVYVPDFDTNNVSGSVRKIDTVLKTAIGGSLGVVTDVEQEFPLNRVDQRNDSIAGSNYSVPVALSEAGTDKRAFTVGALINDGTNIYQVQTNGEDHTRIGVYITNGGSVTGFTDLRITLHNAGDTSQGMVDIPIADLTTLGTGWIYAAIAATLVSGSTYHYHFEMVGETSPTPPVLANSSGTGADTLSFRELYLPTAGLYGTSDDDDLLLLLKDGNIVTGREAEYDGVGTASSVAVAKINSTQFAITSRNTSGNGKLAIGQVSGTLSTFGTNFTFEAAISASFTTRCRLVDNSYVAIAYATGASAMKVNIVKFAGLVISGSTDSYTVTPSTLAGSNCFDMTTLDNSRICVVYGHSPGLNIDTQQYEDLENGNILASDNTAIHADGSADTQDVTTQRLDSDKLFVAYNEDGNTRSRAVVITFAIKGVTPTVNTVVTVESSVAPGMVSAMLDSETVVIAWNGNVKLARISGTIITTFDLTTFGVGAISGLDIQALSDTQAILTYTDAGSSNDTFVAIVTIDKSANTVTIGSPIFSNTAASIVNRQTDLISSNRIAINYTDPADSNKGKVQILHIGSLVGIRESGDDTIASPGDGFLGVSSGTNYDYMPVDFSDDSFWQTWRYEDYIGIDFNTGKVKIPAAVDINDLFAEFNITENLDTKGILRHGQEESLEDLLAQYFPDDVTSGNFTVSGIASLTSVGIGLTEPVSPLHIYENNSNVGVTAGLTIEQDGAGDAIQQFLLTGGQRWVHGINNSDGNKYQIASSADLDSNVRFTINPTNGFVGIGVDSPDVRLEIGGDTSTQVIISANSSNGDPGIQLWDRKTTKLAHFRVVQTAGVLIYLSIGNASNPAIAVDNAGQVGINNVTSPSYTLDVNGDINIQTGSVFRYDGNIAFQFNGDNVGVGGLADANTSFRVQNDIGGIVSMKLTCTHATSPRGLEITFNGGSPDDNTNYFLKCLDTTTTRCYIYSDGDLQNHDNSYGGISDERLKENIRDATNKLQDLLNVKIRHYNFIGEDKLTKKQIGVISQELENIFPGLVHTHPAIKEKLNEKKEIIEKAQDEYKSVQYSLFTPMLIKAFQEMYVDFDKRLKELE